MRTVDQISVRAPVERVFRTAVDVERWPALLRHYRWVRFLDHRQDDRLVEMAAWRPFGLLNYPTWWVSEMRIDQNAPAVHYRHVRGITTGMGVVWQFQAKQGGTEVTIIHEWDGPRWPIVGSAAASWVIGPVFVHGIASRTLAGLTRHIEEEEWRGSEAALTRHTGGRAGFHG